MTKKIPEIKTWLYLTKVIGTIAFFLLTNPFLSQTDTTRQSFSADRKISKENTVKIYQDNLYTVYADLKSVKRQVGFTNLPEFQKKFKDMIAKGDKDLYSECSKTKFIEQVEWVTCRLIEKNKCLIVSNKTLTTVPIVMTKKFIVGTRGGQQLNTQFLIEGRHLLVDKHLLF